MAGDLLVRIVFFILFNMGLSTQAPPPIQPATPVAPAETTADAQCSTYADQASTAFSELKYTDALTILDTAVKDCPADAMVAHLRGAAAYKRYEALYNSDTPAAAKADDVYFALGEMSRAIMLDPTYGDSYFYRGLVFAALNETEHALVDYNKAIEIQPDSPYSYYARGSLYERTGDKTAAIADYKRFLELYKTNDTWRDAAAQHLRGLEKP